MPPPKTINLEVGTLRAVLRRHRLWANMQPDVKMMTVHEKAGKALTEDDEKKLLKACEARRSRALLPIVTVACTRGCAAAKFSRFNGSRSIS